MLVAALPIAPAIAIEEPSLHEPWPGVASVLNWLTWFAFATELAATPGTRDSRTAARVLAHRRSHVIWAAAACLGVDLDRYLDGRAVDPAELLDNGISDPLQ